MVEPRVVIPADAGSSPVPPLNRDECLVVLEHAEELLRPPVTYGVPVHDWDAVIALVNAVPSIYFHLGRA